MHRRGKFSREETAKGEPAEPEFAAKDMFDKTPISKRDGFFYSATTTAARKERVCSVHDAVP